jgi:flagellar motility protein MotE (MotC chaperone)
MALAPAVPDSVAVMPREELPSFAQVLARARTNPGADTLMTGAVPPKPDNAGEERNLQKAPSATAQVAPSPAQRSILERLGERRETLEQRDREIDTRERLLESAELKLEARVNELKALEKNEPSAKQRGEQDAALKGVVTMYETMKPKEAARIFDRLALDVLVPLVSKMSPRKMAEVLAVMQPEAAERLTVALAGRPKSPEARATPPDLPSGELAGVDQLPPEGRKQP